tara:strand:- start:259 stop:804 length:546 start_codon:yes stop_codon:yes gene_type:complete
MVKNMKENTNENSDNIAAIGIGAMIVFIALILVAAVAAAVIIQTAEQLQQNAQSTGEETTDLLASKVTIKSIVIQSTSADLFITFELAPGSDSVTDSAVSWAILCDGNDDYGDFSAATLVSDAAPLTTLDPGNTYDVTITPNTCPPSANADHELMIQSGSGGFTYELLNYGGSVADGQVVV